MPRRSSLAALVSAAVIAALPASLASAAPLAIHNVAPQIAPPPAPAVSAGIAANRVFNPGVATGSPHHELKPARKWVCGPIVNYDGTPHCHWVTH